MASSPSSREVRTIGKIQQAEKQDVTDTESTLYTKALSIDVSGFHSSIYEAGRNEEKQDTEEVALSDGFRDPDDDNTMILSQDESIQNVQEKDEGTAINLVAGEEKFRDPKILSQESTSLIPSKAADKDQKLLIEPVNDSLSKPIEAVRKEENRTISNETKSPESLKGSNTRPGVPTVHRPEALNTEDEMLNALVPVEKGLYGLIKSFQHIQCDSLIGMDPVVEQFNEFFQEPGSTAKAKRQISPKERAKRQEERKKKLEEKKKKQEEKKRQEEKKEAIAEEKKRKQDVEKKVEAKKKPAEETTTRMDRKVFPEEKKRNDSTILNGGPPEIKESRPATNEDIVESPIEVFDAPGNRSTKVVVDRTVVDEIKKSFHPSKPRESSRHQTPSQFSKESANGEAPKETREENDERQASKKKSRPGLPSLPKSLSFWRKKKKEPKEACASGGGEDGNLNTGRPPLPPTNFKARDETSSGTSNWSTSAPKYDRPPAVVIVTNPPSSGFLTCNQRPEANLDIISDQKENSPADDKRTGHSHQEKIAANELSKGFTSMKTASASHQTHDLVKASIFSLPTSTSTAKGTAATQTTNSDEAGPSKLPDGIVQNKIPPALPAGRAMPTCPPQSSCDVEEIKFAIGTAPKKARRRKKKRRKKRRNPLEERKRRKLPSEGYGRLGQPGSQGETAPAFAANKVDSHTAHATNMKYENEVKRLREEVLSLETTNKNLIDKSYLGNLAEAKVQKSAAPDNSVDFSRTKQEGETALQALKPALEKSMAEKIKQVQDEAALEAKRAAFKSSQKASEDMQLIREQYEQRIRDSQVMLSKSAQDLEDARSKEQALQRQAEELASRMGTMNDEKATLASEASSKEIDKEPLLISLRASYEAMLKDQRKTYEEETKQEVEMAVTKLKTEMERSKIEELKRVQEEASSTLEKAVSESNQKVTREMKVTHEQHEQKITEFQETLATKEQVLQEACDRERDLQLQVLELKSKISTMNDEKVADSNNFMEESLSKQRVDFEAMMEEQRKRYEEQAKSLMEINTELQNSNAAFEKETKSLMAKLQEVESLRSQEHQVQKEQFQETQEQKKALEGELARAMSEVDELTKLRAEVDEVESLRVQNAALTSEIKKMKLSIEAMRENEKKDDVEKQRLVPEFKSETEEANSELPVVESKPGNKVLKGDSLSFYSYYSERAQGKEQVGESSTMKLEPGTAKASLEEHKKSMKSLNGSAAESDQKTQEDTSCLQQQLEEVEASEEANLSENNSPMKENTRAKELEGQVDRLEQEKQSMLKAERAMSLRLTQLEQELEVAKSAERAAEELRSELGNTQKMVFDIHNAIKGNGTGSNPSNLSLSQPVLRKESEYDRLITEFDRLMPSHPVGGKKVSFSILGSKEDLVEDEEVKWFSQSRFEI